MRFVVALRHAGFARYLEGTIRGLCEEGHQVVVLLGRQADTSKSPNRVASHFTERLEGLAAELDGLSIRAGVEPRGSRRNDLGGALRSWLDCLRFFEPEFADAPKLRARGFSGLPAALREPTEAAAASPEFRASLAAMVRAVEESLPVPEPARALLAEERPDAVVVCPLIERRTPQVVYLRAARELGIPSAVCVASWDNLTHATLIHGEPDLVTVWNEAQREEAVSLHGIPRERVVPTGAPLYDDWFEQRPSTSREEFCDKVGLPADRPFVLYACSSGFIAPDEAEWIPEWVECVRDSGEPELSGLPVLVRPHPHKRLLADASAAAALEEVPDLAIYPREGAISTSGAELAEHYDSIHHAAAVVGVNTSAMIESAIVGRGVHVLLTRRYRDGQEGMPHFDHLRTAGGGLIEARKKERAHAEGLTRAVRGEDRDLVAERSRAFLEEFVRPHGLDRPVTPIMVDRLIRLAETSVPSVEPAAGPSPEALDDAIATLGEVFRLPSEDGRGRNPPCASKILGSVRHRGTTRTERDR